MQQPTDQNDKIKAGFLTTSIDGLAGLDWLILDYSGQFEGYFSDGIQMFTSVNKTGAYVLTKHPNVSKDLYDVKILNFERFSVVGSDEKDLLHGKDLRDVFQGRGGDDSLYGYGGKDLLKGGAGDDIMVGGDGQDILFGGAGDDGLDGGNGKDLLNGGRGNDGLNGRFGHDVLKGGLGNDVLESSSNFHRLGRHDGNDKMWGGAGADIFSFNVNFGRDKIMDFDTAEDKLYLSAELWNFFPKFPGDILEEYATFHADRVVLDFSKEIPYYSDAVEKLTLMGSLKPDELADAMVFV